MAPSVSLLPFPVPAVVPGHAPTPDAASANKVTFIVFSGELDRLMAAFTMATGAAACGMEVTMFFTFWGTTFLKTRPSTASKGFVERMFGWMLPGGTHRPPLSRLDMGGLGRWLMTREMRKKQMPSLDELIAMARDCGVTFSVCESSMRMMGIDRSELPDDLVVDLCGVAHLWDRAAGGQTIFI